MKKTVIILSVFALIASSCGNKKVPFDYSTLPAQWTVLIHLEGEGEGYAVCDEVEELIIIEGNTLTRLYPVAGAKWELEIVESYQAGDTIVLNVKDSEGKEKFDLKIVWLDKERGIAEWIDDYSPNNTFVTNENLSDFPKVRCGYNDEGLSYIDNIERKSKNPEDFVRSDEIIFEKIFGDLNNDGKEDCVIITKQTRKNAFVTDEYRGELDRNRRGIIIAFNEGEYYHTVLTIPDCFPSENEDGGVYFAPELFVEILKGNLRIHYGHGRYGWWQYTFRYRNNDFELIGYDQSNNRGPVMESRISINFLTKKQQTLTNTNPEAEDESEEVTEETWQDIVINNLVKLTDIRDFSEFNVNSCYIAK
jgi:hypothetical protein